MSDNEEMLICEKCKKAFWISKKVFFNHISKCEGNKDEIIGITWWKTEDLLKPKKVDKKRIIHINTSWSNRPQTR